MDLHLFVLFGVSGMECYCRALTEIECGCPPDPRMEVTPVREGEGRALAIGVHADDFGLVFHAHPIWENYHYDATVRHRPDLDDAADAAFGAPRCYYPVEQTTVSPPIPDDYYRRTATKPHKTLIRP